MHLNPNKSKEINYKQKNNTIEQQSLEAKTEVENKTRLITQPKSHSFLGCFMSFWSSDILLKKKSDVGFTSGVNNEFRERRVMLHDTDAI